MTEYTKDPDAKLDYSKDWASWLAGDTIATSDWTITGPDNSLIKSVSPAPSNSTTKATVWLEGGTDGAVYTVRNRITTAAGRIEDATILIRIKHN